MYMTARTKRTPIILHQKHFWSTLDLPENKRTLKAAFAWGGLSSGCWHKNAGTAFVTSAREQCARLQWGRIFWGDTSAAINFQGIWSWHFQLSACGACESWSSAGPTPGSLQYRQQDICVLMPPSKYLSFFSPSGSCFLYAVLKSTPSLFVILQPLSPAPFYKSSRHYCGSQCDHRELSGILGCWLKEVIDGRSRFPLHPPLHSTVMAQHEGAHWSTYLSKCATPKGQHLVVKFCSKRLLSLWVKMNMTSIKEKSV